MIAFIHNAGKTVQESNLDVLSRLVMLNQPTGMIDRHCFLQGDWQLPHAAGELCVIRWHAVLKGAAWLDLPSGESQPLATGSLLLLTQNSAHRLRQQASDASHILCGSIHMPATSRHFLNTLPEKLYVEPQENSPQRAWMHATLALLQAEDNHAQHGGAALLDHACSMLLTLAIREWLRDAPLGQGLLGALLHARLGHAVTHMLERPAEPWTVASLAALSYMSRASFAELFRQVAGNTPLALLATLRMQLAAQQLSRENTPLTLIAEQVGYASESSFYKAFARHFACTPGEYRQRVRGLEK